MRSVFVALVCLPLASVAAAKDFHFAYAPADLVSPETLYARLDESVTRHCVDINDLRNVRVIQACQRELLRIAVEQIDHPQLTAFVESSRGDGKS